MDPYYAGKESIATQHAGPRYADQPLGGPPTPQANLSHVVQLLVSQSSELRERVGIVASNICGSVPQAENASRTAEPNCLIDVLQIVVNQLQRALAEVERVQSRL